MHKLIRVPLSEAGIRRAISEVGAYEKRLNEKTNEFRQILAERLAKQIRIGFFGAIADDIISNGHSPAEARVTVSVLPNAEKTIVVASGEDAVWVEFGAGVYHNGPTGTVSSPYGTKLGFSIGSYGPRGQDEAWSFNRFGETLVSRGTPGKAPMYHAVQYILQEATKIAQEVFRD